jgi:sugar transferase (PEP-CTERM/EpsH1 system associated)
MHLVHAFQTGGAERVVLNLVRHAGAGVENFVCSLTEPNDLAAQLPATASAFHCMHKKSGNDPSVVAALARLIDRWGVDLVHAQSWGTYLEGLVAAKVLSRRRPAFVFAFHGKSLEEARNGMPLRRRAAQRVAHWITDACVAPAQHMAEDYARSVGIRPDRIRVIYNGIDTQSFRPSRDDAVRAELGFADHDFVVGFVGRLDPVKDIRGILTVFARFRQELATRGSAARLLIVGDGEEREPAHRAVIDLGLEGCVVFAGLRSDISRCLAALDVYLQPSHYEGHSLTLLEAMASGLPVVSTAVGGTPEVVRPGHSGYLHSPGDYASMVQSLLELYRDPALRRSLGEAGREDVRLRFSVETMVGSYERLYRELLGVSERQCAA